MYINPTTLTINILSYPKNIPWIQNNISLNTDISIVLNKTVQPKVQQRKNRNHDPIYDFHCIQSKKSTLNLPANAKSPVKVKTIKFVGPINKETQILHNKQHNI